MHGVAEKKRQPPHASPPQKGARPAGGAPSARGHRFGPTLTCAFCGISYGVHHRDPRTCPHEEAAAAADDSADPCDAPGGVTPS